MKLLGSVPSPYTRKVRIVLAEKKVECEFETVDVNPPENPVNARNPLGKVPALVMDDGTLPSGLCALTGFSGGLTSTVSNSHSTFFSASTMRTLRV